MNPRPEATQQLDRSKLCAVVLAMREAFRRGAPLSFPADFREVEWALVEFGCFGDVSDLDPLERWVDAFRVLWSCDRAEAFARFDRALDWILEQPTPPYPRSTGR